MQTKLPLPHQLYFLNIVHHWALCDRFDTKPKYLEAANRILNKIFLKRFKNYP